MNTAILALPPAPATEGSHPFAIHPDMPSALAEALITTLRLFTEKPEMYDGGNPCVYGNTPGTMFAIVCPQYVPRDTPGNGCVAAWVGHALWPRMRMAPYNRLLDTFPAYATTLESISKTAQHKDVAPGHGSVS